MPEIIENFGRAHEVMALVAGVLSVLISVIFLLQKFGVYTITFFDINTIPESTFTLFFAFATLVLGIICLITTVGFIGSR